MSAKDARPIATFDIETDPFKRGRYPLPFAADIFTGSYHQTWWGAQAAKDMLSEVLARPPCIWYAHNGGKFDFHYLIEYLPRKLITKFLSIGGRIVQIGFENGTEFRDSYALIPRPLREWAKDDIDYRKLEVDVRQQNCAEIISYLKKDTEYLYEMVQTFILEYGRHLTLASAAFHILHKKFDVKRSKISEQMDAKFRRYYFAGRVEFYSLGNLGSGYSCVDINSSFPWSMTLNHWEGDMYMSMSTFPTRHFEQSFFRIISDSNGAFAYRNEDGSVSFPSDGKQREFYTTGWEYKAASDLRLLSNVRLISAFVPLSIRNYKEYIDYFYKIKSSAESSGNKGERLFAKLLMNSGYGKFGMDPREFEELRVCDYRTPPDNTDEWTISKDDGNLGITIYKRTANGGYDKFNNVCVAASITGCSRALLLRAIHNCDDVVYCDTDSIIARNVSKLDIGGKLGQWKIESEFEQLHIGGKKLYAGLDRGTQKWKTASKGVRLSADQIIQVASSTDVTYEFEAPSYSIRGSIKGDDGKAKWHRFTKRTIRRADKRLK